LHQYEIQTVKYKIQNSDILNINQDILELVYTGTEVFRFQCSERRLLSDIISSVYLPFIRNHLSHNKSWRRKITFIELATHYQLQNKCVHHNSLQFKAQSNSGKSRQCTWCYIYGQFSSNSNSTLFFVVHEFVFIGYLRIPRLNVVVDLSRVFAASNFVFNAIF